MKNRATGLFRALLLFEVFLGLVGCCADSSSRDELDQRQSFEASTRAELNAEQSESIAALLRDGRLAPLPDDARDLRFGSWSGVFTGQACLVFTASPEEIERFVEGSDGLRGVDPSRFGEGRKNLPLSERGPEVGFGHRYYQPNSVFDWYAPTLHGRGRRYEIPPDQSRRGHNWGEVVVDDERQRAFVEVTWD